MDSVCGLCGGDLSLLGTMGDLMWCRCRDCGAQVSRPRPDGFFDEGDDDDDQYYDQSGKVGV